MSLEAWLNPEVEKLWELQTVLSELEGRERQLTEKPESFASVDREWQSVNALIEQLQGEIETISRERRRVEGELSDQQEQLKKYQGQLMQVKNQQQYAAAWKEIDASRKHVKDLEESALKSMGEIEALQKQLDDQSDSTADLKGRWDASHEAWQSSLGDLRGEVEKLKKRAGAIEEKIPERMRREFHRIFKQRQGQAMVRTDNDSCGSCRSRIRPALYQQLNRGELVYCEVCSRILYREKATS